jgi:hypothetical protein
MRYVEHFRECLERKELVQIADENRPSWVELDSTLSLA